MSDGEKERRERKEKIKGTLLETERNVRAEIT